MMGKKSGRKSNWRQIISQRNQVHEVELPSGMVVVSRKPDMLDFVLGGDVPQTFFSEMMNLSGQGTQVDPSQLSGSAFKTLMDVSEGMMKVCCVDPIVWDGPTVLSENEEGSESDKLSVKDIGGNDKMAYFTWATGDADALKTFRAETGAVGKPTPDGEGVQLQAE